LGGKRRIKLSKNSKLFCACNFPKLKKVAFYRKAKVQERKSSESPHNLSPPMPSTRDH